MIEMHGFWRSSAAYRVRIALNLKGLPFRETFVDLDAGEQNRPDYRAINPQGTVPTVLFEDGTRLTQSLAILEYLEETHPEPPLLPADPAGRARVRGIAGLFATDHHPVIVPRVRRYLRARFGVDPDGEGDWVRHWLEEGLRIGEARLSAEPETGRFCHGDTPTIADLCLASHMAASRVFGADLSVGPTLLAIERNFLELDAFDSAQPSKQKR
ncbi:maleylacetoacetate isomerase [Acetobacteraceae bacterium KSS8]|uniref:Maleylacetoacetate isomerase n=1 Tax=Endosaccharibacter trunci TaxID=2812733 RepID=A0ABT1W674_9PROT|nr:maleylacetoacetate isomerase [Acetobacteraceae bacterium KSS8]